MKVLILLSAFLVTSTASAMECKKSELIDFAKAKCEIIASKGKDALQEFKKPDFLKIKICNEDTYAWVHDVKNKMHVHVSPTLIAMPDLSALKSPRDKVAIFEKFTECSSKKGESCFVGYDWTKPNMKATDPDAIADKCSFLMNCDGEFIVGLGVYQKCADLK